MEETRKPSVSPKGRRRSLLPEKEPQSSTELESTSKEKQSDLVSAKNKEVKCTICLDTSRRRKMKVLPCTHEFHRKCINEWGIINWKCPLCRQPYLPDMFAALGNRITPLGRSAQGSFIFRLGTRPVSRHILMRRLRRLVNRPEMRRFQLNIRRDSNY
ncbi:e3 ubiquitin-protein ligase ATL15 [Nephila pilipes]|uniref:RING-type E3 ubiquitin transferase n=1 Tax=Nephila pilipes TaxID=299642 RepID=A0A8X6JYA5_NEPPI|nr:e3 ubiquitin-protein ligase ATL15 [Nephila pilipes]